MRYYLPFLLCFFLQPCMIVAQVFPEENDTLNYTIIGFRFQEKKKEKNYRIEIAAGDYNEEAEFKKNIIKSATWNENKGILQVPSFGKKYTWRVITSSYSFNGPGMVFHHFSTGYFPDTDTAIIRMNITHKADEYKDAYLITDGNRTMYDMSGNPVWYMRDLGGIIRSNSQVRDVKLSARGTITLLVDGRAFETDYNGRILWEGPTGRKRLADTLEGYHHELTRLSNGHYMVLGFDPIIKPKPFLTDSNGKKIVTDSAGRRIKRPPPRQNSGNLIEYDESGKVIWEWRAANYFNHVDMDFYKKSNGMPEFDIHENSFYFDEKNKVIYLSFRNISQVLKISYPSGEVSAAFGKLENPSDSMENHFFCSQHSCHISDKGDLYLYDNACGIGHIPSIVVIKLPLSEKDTLKKVWEYSLPVEPQPVDDRPVINSIALNKRFMFTAGGNVMELPDHSYFVSANVPYNKLFIITLDKQILWSALMEKWHADKNIWEAYSQYRISIIPNRAQLENLIWKSTGK